MTIFSVLTTIYVTSIIAGLAYQQVKPILDYVPSVAMALVNIIGKAKEHWEKVTLPEDREHIAQARTFIDEYQSLANWILRKLAVRLIMGWGILGLSIGVSVLGFGSFFNFNEIENTTSFFRENVGALVILVILIYAAIVGIVMILKMNSIAHSIAPWKLSLVIKIKQFFAEKFKDNRFSTEELKDNWFDLWSRGKTLYEDVTSAYQLGISLSSISSEEWIFIRRYVEAVEWLRMVDAMSANLAWLQLDLGRDVQELMKKGEEYMISPPYKESYYYYVCALNLLEKEKATITKSKKGSKINETEAEIRYHLGRLLAHKKDASRAVQYFERAIELAPSSYKREKICSSPDRLIEEIRETPAFRKFCRKYNKQEAEEN